MGHTTWEDASSIIVCSRVAGKPEMRAARHPDLPAPGSETLTVSLFMSLILT
jgi:hypothetical protein